ncbi:LysR family transcriptional regulator [Azospirillum rugosum]|uniref:DNA-binding transcriptional LysR family regulator n=1 Tax=Azospirillum rugosum TaxID=416170 RepID=A0ABS4SXE9_9PROT|nr:LysR family transcriptional regulator [Azospirillum rugosum]MBP2297239.1 DNA-binding transcriptional LysR family regulator [Azospirillum rugosum]MDQ0531081.1 DNA-binding transcriptional LysR family regulator [Azospirillum rugosum]
MAEGDREPEIQLRQLRYVIAAAEYGSFRQAAIAVGVQESAISRRIRDLEDLAGAALFIRHHRGVTLTEAGKSFLRRARAAINEIDLAVKEVGAAGRVEKGMIRIGIFTSLASGFLAELLARYGEQLPGIHPKFVEGAPTEHIAAVRQHEIDIAFLTGNPQVVGCETTRLWGERVFVVVSEKHELAAMQRIEWTDLRGRHFIVTPQYSRRSALEAGVERISL